METTEQSPEFLAMEEQLKETTHLYKDISKAGQLLKKKEVESGQPFKDIAGHLDQASQSFSQSDGSAGDRSTVGSAPSSAAEPSMVLAEDALKKYANCYRALAAQKEIHAGYVNEVLITTTTQQLDGINQIKNLRKKLEDSRIEYDSIRADEKNGKATKEDLEKARKTYENLRSQVSQKMSDTEYQKSTAFIHNLTDTMKAHKKYHEESLKAIAELETLWQQLEEQVPRGSEDAEGSIQVELNLLRLQRAPQTIVENIETSVKVELQFLEESGRATGDTKEAKLAKVLQEKLNSMSG